MIRLFSFLTFFLTVVSLVFCKTWIEEDEVILGVKERSIRFACRPSRWTTLCMKVCILLPTYCKRPTIKTTPRPTTTTTTTTKRPTTPTTTKPTTSKPTTTRPSTTSTTTELPATTLSDVCSEPFSCVGKVNGQYVNPFNCSDMITCDNGGIQLTRQCPHGHYLNLSSDRCQAMKLDCVNICDNEPPTPSPPPTKIHHYFGSCTETCDNKPDGIYPSPLSCEYYYTCKFNEEESISILETFQCEEGQQFNPMTKKCEIPGQGLVCWVCAWIIKPSLRELEFKP